MSTVTEADILTEVVAPGSADLSPEAARSILALQFKPSAIQRMNELADKNNRGDLTEAERAEMDKYVRVGLFLDLFQAKARQSLSRTDGVE
jgi:uncharacterized protein YnzC (UPF0291/DUF896 family)